MKNLQQTAAAHLGFQSRSACLVCKNQIVDNKWFCRLPQKTGDAAGGQATEILLCSPSCAFRHFANLENETTTHR